MIYQIQYEGLCFTADPLHAPTNAQTLLPPILFPKNVMTEQIQGCSVCWYSTRWFSVSIEID